ncbi:dihydropteroate synthase [Agromyces silvae]|uniref:dihydropteroate synthase n=1 Tax=Agromyces silvae TaxID=3388266 RepID=UPI00280BE28D|nr:dihydropteroate synthase [Agromyces protaetiae]
MGVVNVTPDSFSDGGRWFDADAAIAHGQELIAQGADLVDVGGESTRPGAARVEPDEELRRVIPVVRELSARGIRVSVDTMRAATAEAAVEAGAEIINDVSAGLADDAMAAIAAASGARYVAMHWRGHSDRMDRLAEYEDVAREVRDELAGRVDALVAAGVPAERLIVDPGLGFAKRGEHNWQLLARLDELQSLGLPVLVGASRKRFIGSLLPGDAPVEDRDLPTAVISALAAQAGAWAVRVHDVVSTRRALDVVGAWQSGRRG